MLSCITGEYFCFTFHYFGVKMEGQRSYDVAIMEKTVMQQLGIKEIKIDIHVQDSLLEREGKTVTHTTTAKR